MRIRVLRRAAGGAARRRLRRPVGRCDVVEHASSSGGDLSGTLTVFAAASLTDVFTDLGNQLEKANPGLDVRFNFAGSSALATQITQGAPGRRVRLGEPGADEGRHGRGARGRRPEVFTENVLEIAVPQGNPGHVTGLADFAEPDLTLAICAPDVPCGAAAAEGLPGGRGRRRCRTPRRRTSGPRSPRWSSVRSTPRWSTPPTCAAGVQGRGHRRSRGGAGGQRVPDRRSEGAPNPDAARAFVDLVRSDAGRGARDAGFRRPTCDGRHRAARSAGGVPLPLLVPAASGSPSWSCRWSGCSCGRRGRRSGRRSRSPRSGRRCGSRWSRRRSPRRLDRARRAAGLGARPVPDPRPDGAARAGHRAARAAARGRRRRAVPGARAAGHARALAVRAVRRHDPVHHDRRRHRRDVRGHAVPGDQRRGGAAGRGRPLRGRRRHARADRWTTFRRVTLPLVAPGHRRRRGALLGPRAGRVRRDHHLRRQLPRDTQTMPLAVYLALQHDPEAAIALSLVLLVVSLATLLLLRDRWLGRSGPGRMSLSARVVVPRGALGARRRRSRSPTARCSPSSARTAPASRPCCASWPGCCRPTAGGRAGRRHGLDDARPAPAAHRRGRWAWCSRTTCSFRTSSRRQRGVRAAHARASAGRRPGRRRRVAGPGGARRPGRPPAGPALRRSGAAGRAGPGAGGRARVLLLDEPLSALDARTRLPCGPSCAGTWPTSPAAPCWSPTTRSTRWRWPTGWSWSRTAASSRGHPAEVSRHPRTDYVARLVGLSLLPRHRGRPHRPAGRTAARSRSRRRPPGRCSPPSAPSRWRVPAPARGQPPQRLAGDRWSAPPRTAPPCAASWPARCR